MLKPLILPTWGMTLIALIWAMVSFGMGSADVGAQSNIPYNTRIVTLVVTPENPPSLYALAVTNRPWGGDGRPLWGIYRSRDGGRGWAAINMRGLADLSSASSLAVDYRNPGVLYLAGSQEPFPYGSNYLFKSVDGNDWERVSGPIQGLSALAVDLKDSNMLYAGVSAGQGSFLRSLDGGRTWRPFDNRSPDPSKIPTLGQWSVGKILVDPVDSTTLYAVQVWTYRFYDARLLRGDGQGNWVQIAAPRSSGGVLGIDGIAFDPTTRSLYLGSGPWGGGGTVEPTARKLWRCDNPAEPDPSRAIWSEVASFDLGRWGWQATVPSVDPLAVDAGRDKALYLQTHAGDTALWKSEDRGKTWQTLPLPQPRFVAPATDQAFAWTIPDTGHTVSGEWLAFLKGHGDTDNLGYPRTEVIADPMAAGQTVQYFQRLVLEWHPENPPAYRIQRRLLGDIIYPGADPPVDPEDTALLPRGDVSYFPSGPGIGLGHYVADYASDGTAIHFKEYFDGHGGVDAFGFPKEEPKLRNGLWTQRFQAAVFEYHPEHDVEGYLPGTDIPWRNYRVQLELLGDRYIEVNKLTYR